VRGSLLRAANVADPGSLSNRFRSRRFAAFAGIVEWLKECTRPVRIIDVGGTSEFWRQRGWRSDPGVEITVVNLQGAAHNGCGDGVHQMHGDATDLRQFEDMAFDVVFSNSTIEHLGGWRGQRCMADEVRRLAPVYWVQTPNYWFPIEPHFLVPCWHYLPVRTRARLIRSRRFGHRGPCPNDLTALALVQEIRLVTVKELELLFPDAEVLVERFGPLTKSLVAVRGHPGPPPAQRRRAETLLRRGADRNRTGVNGFAGRCVATPPRRRSTRTS
jgi:Methyltransferase domain